MTAKVANQTCSCWQWNMSQNNTNLKQAMTTISADIGDTDHSQQSRKISWLTKNKKISHIKHAKCNRINNIIIPQVMDISHNNLKAKAPKKKPQN